MNKTKKSKQEKGITLIALIITIVVLLILAIVTIRAVQGDGIIQHAKNATSATEQAQADEEQRLLEYEYQIASSQGNFKGSYDEYILDKKYAGLNLGDKVNYTVDGYSGEWRVLGIENGQVLLVATKNPTWKNLSGSDTTLGVWDEETKSYKNAEDELDRICESYLNSTYATKARSIRVEDIDKITGYDKTTYGAAEADIYKYGNEVTYSINSGGKVAYSSTAKSGTSSYTTFMKPQSTSNITEPFIVTSTGYFYDVDKETELKNTTSNIYKMLFGSDNQAYWLASSYVITQEEGCGFAVRQVSHGKVSGFTLWSSDLRGNGINNGVRPVVYLKSDIQLTETTANSGVWNIG